MISRLFTSVLNMSLTASLVILCVFAARFLLRKAPRIFSYCLWAVVLFRLLCPVSFSTPFSLLGTVENAQVKQGSLTYFSDITGNAEISDGAEAWQEDTNGQWKGDIAAEDVAPVQGVQKELGANTSRNAFNVWSVLAFIWMAGMLVIAVYDIATLWKLRRELKGAVQVERNIYTSDFSTPFVLGVIRPRIYLPAGLQGEEREYILLHEQIHIRRKDHWVKLLASVALCMHWFNPLVWAAFFLSSKDMEMACDEAVLRKMGARVKKEYSASLLNLATGKRVISGVPLAFGEGDTGSRIKNVLRYKKPATIAVCGAVLICLALGLCLISNPRQEDASGGPEDHLIDHVGQQEDSQKQNTGEQETQGSEAPGQDEQEVSENPFITPFLLQVRKLSVENRTVDNFVVGYQMEKYFDGAPIRIADDCIFKANYQMNTVQYEEISFETFAEMIAGDFSTTCYVTMDEQGEYLKEICVYSANAYQGVEPSNHTNEAADNMMKYLKKTYGENVVAEQFELVATMEADISDREGVETIDIFTAMLEGYMEMGLLMYRDAQGEVLCIECEEAYPYPTTYYVNESSEGTYLMRIHEENRDTHGEYYYNVYRLDENGRVKAIAGSTYSWDSGKIYYEEMLRQWVDKLNSYYKGSKTLMEAGEDEIVVGGETDADRYSFENLSDFTKYDTVTIY